MMSNQMDVIKDILIPQSHTWTDLLELHRFYTARVSKTIARSGPGVHCTVQKVPAHWYYLVWFRSSSYQLYSHHVTSWFGAM